MSKKRLQSLLPILVLALLGVAFGYGIGSFLKGQTQSLEISRWMIALAPVILVLVLAWHEFGHVMGGWLSGFEMHLYAVGPIRIDRTGDGSLQVRLNRTLSLWGGVAASVPPPDCIPHGEQMRISMLRLVAGGPLASLFGALAWFPAQVIWRSQPELAFCFGLFGIASFAIFVATMLPLGNGGFVTDGGRILQLLRNLEDGQRWCAMAILSSMSVNLRPKEWPGSLVEAITKGDPATYDGLMAIWMRHSWHLDRKEYPEAKQWLEKGLENVLCWAAAAQPMMHASALYFYAKVEGDPAKARQHLEAARKPGFLSKEAVLVSEAALLRAENDFVKARELVEKARPLILQSAGTNRIAMEEMLTELSS